jgi:hypothetical protein
MAADRGGRAGLTVNPGDGGGGGNGGGGGGGGGGVHCFLNGFHVF